MKDFYVDKQIVIGHSDGWRYVVYTEDNPVLIGIKAENLGEDGIWEEDVVLDGIWSECARLLAQALIECADTADKSNNE